MWDARLAWRRLHSYRGWASSQNLCHVSGSTEGAEIRTIEGLAQDGELHPIQEGFWECHGLQCGFCTPGMIMAAHQLLERNPNPTEEEIWHGIEGNFCRCTGYQHIVDAIQYAAEKMQG